MATAGQEAGGWFEAMRRAGSSAFGLLRTRFSLFAVELQEEKLRAIDLLIWLAAAVALGTAGLLLGIGTLALFLWKTTGYWGLIGLAVATLAAAAGVLWRIRREILNGVPPFAATTAEFEKDFECLKQKD